MPMKSVAARTEPCESVRLRYRVHTSGKTIRTPTKIMAGAAKSHLRCRFDQAEKFPRMLGGRPALRAGALPGAFSTDMVHLKVGVRLERVQAGRHVSCRPAWLRCVPGSGALGKRYFF